MTTGTAKAKNIDDNKSDLIEALEKQIESLQSDVHALIKSVNGQDGQKTIIDTASEAIADTTQKSADEMAKDLEKVTSLIKAQPLVSVGLALGVGALFAFLARN